MKTAVSIPDDVFAAADALAKARGTSRSDVYARALRDYLSRNAPDQLTAQMDAAVDAAGPADPLILAAAARQLRKHSAW
jgi:metal-responsive CopG/Arc/MetJ family transcriptional regulator